MNRFATSDEHLGHQNILTGWDGKQTPRPFATMDDMVEGIIDRHNAVVRDNDEVFHLGDMFWRTFGLKKAIWVRQRLRGQHFYILGNHDEMFWKDEYQTVPSDLQQHFNFVGQRLFLKDKLNRHGIVLDHYAGRVWKASHKGAWQLYGHSHGHLPEEDYLSMDVGVDANSFTPVSFDDIAAKLRGRLKRREAKIKENHTQFSILDSPLG